MFNNGSFWFGLVLGFITYRTLKHKSGTGLSDIAAVIGAIGGGAVLGLFPVGTASFDHYAGGLATGFFLYMVISVIIAATYTKIEGSTQAGGRAANEFLDD